MHMRSRTIHVAWLSCIIGAVAAHADQDAIRASIAEFFETRDAAARAEIVTQILANPDYERGRVCEWLHQADLFAAEPAGVQRISVPLRDGTRRDVLVRIPDGYDHRRPWPMLYALHGTGGTAAGILRFYEQLLGQRIDEFIVVAPDRYQEMIIYHAEWPPLAEHPTIRRAIRRRFHIDNDRVFVSGYSRGGHTTWMQMLLHADEFAAGLALAGTFVMPEAQGVWETWLPNLANTHLLCVYGDNDVLDPQGNRSAHGGITGLNRGIAKLNESLALPIKLIELPDTGHANNLPPDDELAALLEHTRTHYPRSFKHTFRHEYQGAAYWVEAHVWSGAQWADQPPKITLRADENANNPEHVRQAAARAYRALLGEIRGEVNGQEIRVYRKRIKELTIWFPDGLFDWDQPLSVKANGRKIFEGAVEPSLFVCLSQAARTYDFDRLRWAGLRYRSGARARLVDQTTTFPDLLAPSTKPGK